MNRSYWYKHGMIVYWKPIYGKGYVGESWVLARPGDKEYAELAKATHEMLPKSMAALVESIK
jgi:hypothetical protein